MKGLSIPILLLGLAAVGPAVAATPEATALITQAQDAQVKGDHELALRLAQAAIVADPTKPQPYVALGDIYARQGQAEFARSYYDAALEVDPQDAAAQRGIAALANPAKAAAATP
jgi:Flp pilus assembly protein TadD